MKTRGREMGSFDIDGDTHDAYATVRAFSYFGPTGGPFSGLACTVPDCDWRTPVYVTDQAGEAIDRWTEHALAQ